ncbi:MAG TPA: hypothetical protein VHY91_06380 [Pirellulales bacterium]|jgi:hypothetical protein|nr:hypothetical protein [Pirellulales bacterium]
MSKITSTTPGDTPALDSEQLGLCSQGRGAEGGRRRYRRGGLPNWIGPVAILLFGTLVVIPELLQKWLWMRQLNYVDIFWTLLSVKWGMAQGNRMCFTVQTR